jgi:hypothetical protein
MLPGRLRDAALERIRLAPAIARSLGVEVYDFVKPPARTRRSKD